MSASEDLFPPVGDDPQLASEEESRTWTVPQVAAQVKQALGRAFPDPFWLAGETSGLGRAKARAQGRGPAGHWYFQLVDDAETDARKRGSLEVTMWGRTVANLFGTRGRLRGRLDPDDGLVMRVLVRPDFYAPHGKLSFHIEDVDPDYTLGNLDRERRELLTRLEHEGALARNGALPLDPVPLRLGLVTSDGSAAHHDVLETLTGSGLGLAVWFCDARTQGADTGPSVSAALATLARLDLDAILVVRGGGSRLDLSWFDKEVVARAIADCPTPVLTGIGHEIDTSVADAVAHTSFKTPTAAAEFVVERVREARDELERQAAWLAERVTGQLADEGDRLRHRAGTLRLLATSRLDAVGERLSGDGRRLRDLARTALLDAGLGLRRRVRRLVDGPATQRVEGLEQALLVDRERILARARSLLDRAGDRLDAAEQRARLLDPARILARGYATLRRPDGGWVLDAADTRAGERLAVTLRDGALDVMVEATRPAPRTEAGDEDTDGGGDS